MRQIILFLTLGMVGLSPKFAYGVEPLLPNRIPAASNREVSVSSFWSEANNLVQRQINLIQRIEESLSTSVNPNLAFATEGQIILHQGRVERFLKALYPLPKLLCTRTNGYLTEGVALNEQQLQVYCALFESQSLFNQFRDPLERRAPNLASYAQFSPLPTGRNQPLRLYQTPPPQQIVPQIPPPEPPILGREVKDAIANYQPPLPPALGPSEPILRQLAQVKSLTNQAIALFPAGSKFVDMGMVFAENERSRYSLKPQEVAQYADFLKIPNRGVSRLLPAELYQPDPNELQNRALGTIADRFPFSALPRTKTNLMGEIFTPRFKLRLNQGQFQIVPQGLDYGFLTDLGDLPLEAVEKTLTSRESPLNPALRSWFFNYQPPNQLADLTTDRQRFVTGKGVPLASEIPAQLNRTYLLRLVQFQLPEPLLARQPVSRSDRRYLDLILETPSSDVLIAFRPVRRVRDGSYVVLWQVIQEFPDPKIQDLDRYILMD